MSSTSSPPRSRTTRSDGGWRSGLPPERFYTAVVHPLDLVLRGRAQRLVRAGCETARLDAELLLGRVLGLDRAGLMTATHRQMSFAEMEAFDDLVDRREAREPIAYILGERAFRRITLSVDPRVLIPRPETELLVEAGLSLPAGIAVADVGTGSGAVALALADERPDLRMTGLDVSADAVEVARANARRLGKAVEFVCADLLGGGAYDAVLANLPYVADGDRGELAPEITRYEPAEALFAGPDGLEVIRRLVDRLPAAVGFVALEIGHAQGAAVAGLLADAGFADPDCLRDLAGHVRVVVGRR